MAKIETQCPHCHRNASIEVSHRIADGPGRGTTPGLYTQWAEPFQDEAQRAATAEVLRYVSLRSKGERPATAPPKGPQRTAAFAGRCSFTDCGGPVLLIARLADWDDDLRQGNQAFATAVRRWELGDSLLAIFPNPPSGSAHQAWPLVAKEILPELVEDLGRNRAPSRILAGARTILDVSLKELLGNEKVEGRSAAIQKLRERGVVTESLALWAKSLWRDGSDAVHDGAGSRELAVAYLDFLRVFLRLAFELPVEIEALRQKDASAEEGYTSAPS